MNKKIKKLIIRLGSAALLAVLALTINYFIQPDDKPTSGDPTTLVGELEVHFIDVGQGDSILIKDNSHAMLIDAGENDKGEIVLDYLKSQKVEKLDYIIGTHPHSDHIGGLDTVIEKMNVDYIIMPKVAHTTKTYGDLLDAIQAKNIAVKQAKVGDTYSLGDANFTILSPSSPTYDEMNNYSVGIKLTLGKISFVMAGDAEKLSETEITKTGIDLSADVLKLSHHGASNAINEDFYNAVHPKFAVISVGKDNDYNHPNPKTLLAMMNHGIKIFRTDVQGSIVFRTDGTTLINKEKPYVITKNDIENKK